MRKCSGFALIVLTVVIGKKGWDSRGNWTNQSCNCKNHKRASIAAAGFWWLFFLLKTLLNAAKQNRILWPTRDDYDFYNISHKSRKISQFYENSNLVLCFSHLIICHFCGSVQKNQDTLTKYFFTSSCSLQSYGV